MATKIPRPAPLPVWLTGLIACTLGAQAFGGITFRLDRPQATPGETLEVEAVYTNDTDAAAVWQVPSELVLQWRGSDGQVVRSVAERAGGTEVFTVPVQRFVQMRWQAVVPPGLDGLQAVVVEGSQAMLALDTSARETATVASRPADVPVLRVAPDQSVAVLPQTALPPGADGAQGPSPVQVASGTQGGWEHFRSALSPHDPMYFVLGARGGWNARFQISMRYRLFQPPSNQPPAFHQQLYVGYTQNSLWDLDSPSKPFYDTTYNPSLFWSSEDVWNSASKRWALGMAAGVEHQSNGRDGEASRSLNAAFAQPAVRLRLDNGSTIRFAPRLRQYFAVADENSNIVDYRGKVDWHLSWQYPDGLYLAGLYRRGKHGRDAVQVDFAWPLRKLPGLSGMNGYFHVQYFNGYGETLRSYNQRSPSQWRAGLMLVH